MMMVKSRRLLTVVSLLSICFLKGPSWRATATTDPNDVTTLKTLYNHWAGASNNIPTNWVGSDPCGTSWAGVTCDPTSTFVTELDLKNFNLTEGIPSQIGDLSHLESLDLSFNLFLQGTLPRELGQLTSLEFLIIMNCGLTGTIPDELGQLTKLGYLALNHNNLTGPIPAAIGNLQLLTWFDISENSLSGPLPISTSSTSGLDSLSSVVHFHFNNNSLNGNIPKEIFNLPHLLHLLLYSNAFEGSIPPAISSATGLAILRLDNNLLSGTLPPGLNELSSLKELGVSNNSFSGALPDLSSVTTLQLLDVSHNPFSGQDIPAWVYSLQAAETITMDSANLTGPVNSTIFKLPKLSVLSLSDNSLTGDVSIDYPSSSLQTVDLQNNKIQSYRSSLQNTEGPKLLLYGNPFCSIGSNNKQTVCQLYDDEPQSWSAPANPSCHTSCGGGQALNPQLCSCASALLCLMKLTSPAFTYINQTGITDISNEFANYFNLDPRQVYISSAIFEPIGQMTFDMYFFPLAGASLTYVQVKNITGGLSSTRHHLNAGPYLLVNAVPPTISTKKKKSSALGLIIGVIVAAVIVGLIIALIAAYAIRQKMRADKAEVSRPFASWGTSTKDSGDAPQLKGAKWYSLAELRKATDNFSEKNELGRGGYGKVYKAELPGGVIGAVKRADESSVQGAVEFKNEIELLSRVHHRNLVGLLGFCYEHGEQALVYEYMPNGTLCEHLLGRFDAPLTWDMRVAIALGSARGLAYLHELANPPIIHRDIKSGNILLDEKMEAKVADFGLSKLAPDGGGDKGHVSTQVKGTLGYLDPEYYMTNQLSEKSDVYSFGVVLLEMLSARPPIERGRYIVREVRTALNKGGMRALEPLLDPLLGDYPPKQLEAVLDLAMLCVEEVAAGRPTMSEVVKKLEVIVGHSHPNSGIHITIEPQKSDDIYGKDYLPKGSDPSFHYSGVSLTAHANVEPK